EDIAAHVDAGRTLLYRIVGHRQSLELGKLFAAGHHDRHRTRGRHRLKAVFDKIGFYILRAELGDDATGQREIFGIAHHGFAYSGDAHDRHARTQTGIDQPRHVVHRPRLMLAADEDLDTDSGCV